MSDKSLLDAMHAVSFSAGIQPCQNLMLPLSVQQRRMKHRGLRSHGSFGDTDERNTEAACACKQGSRAEEGRRTMAVTVARAEAHAGHPGCLQAASCKAGPGQPAGAGDPPKPAGDPYGPAAGGAGCQGHAHRHAWCVAAVPLACQCPQFLGALPLYRLVFPVYVTRGRRHMGK